ncbi:MAG: methionine synthase [Calditrichaeota bacterium]|nr:methionine synthase [Calditrichota bacterium]
MGPMLDRLKGGEVLVADGAMGTLLLDKGLQVGECPEALNHSKPEILKDIALRYLQAGADIVQTNTFGGSPMKLKEYGLEDKTEEINQRAASLVREIVNDRAYVSGSCGPSGRILVPYGDTEPEVLYSGFERQIRSLVEAGVDVVCIETMTDLREAVLAVQAAKAVSARTTVMATMTFDETPRGFYTIMGVSVAEAAAGLQEAGADVIGSNCGNGIENMVRIAREFKKGSSLPVIIQSNAGKPEIKDGRPYYPEPPALFAEKARELTAAGVSIIGGCCGTTGEHIRAIREVVDSRRGR